MIRLLLLLLLAGPAAADPLAGLWQTVPEAGEVSGLVRIGPCEARAGGPALCGTLEGVRDAQGREVPAGHVGRLLLWDAVPISSTVWRARVYSAARDAEYAAILDVDGDAVIIRTCVLRLCGSPDIWLRLD